MLNFSNSPGNFIYSWDPAITTTTKSGSSPGSCLAFGCHVFLASSDRRGPLPYLSRHLAFMTVRGPLSRRMPYKDLDFSDCLHAIRFRLNNSGKTMTGDAVYFPVHQIRRHKRLSHFGRYSVWPFDQVEVGRALHCKGTLSLCNS